ncbi:MAG: DUF2971 domain-containing protein [Vicinamibacterales bacterium]
MMMEDLEKALAQAGARIQAALNAPAFSTQRPEHLYHFTDHKGLLGILTTNELWASLANTMNDSTECRLWREELSFCLRMRLLQTTHLDADFVAAALETNRSLPPFDSFDARHYIVSFCTDQVSALHWLHYGRSGSGVAIRFKTEHLANRFPFNLLPVVYDADARRRIYASVLNPVDALVGEWASQMSLDFTQSAAVSLITGYLSYAAPQFKDDSFKSEQEWRLALGEVHRNDADGSDVGPPLFQATAAKGIVPYRPIKFDPAAIDEIVVGHDCEYESTRRTIGLLLESLKREVTIRRSGVPVTAR